MAGMYTPTGESYEACGSISTMFSNMPYGYVDATKREDIILIRPVRDLNHEEIKCRIPDIACTTVANAL